MPVIRGNIGGGVRATAVVAATATVAGTNISGTIASNVISLSVSAANNIVNQFAEPHMFVGPGHVSSSAFIRQIVFPINISVTRVDILQVAQTTALTGTRVLGETYSVGIYTMSGSTANLASSGSGTRSANSDGAVSISGTRYFSIPVGTWNVSNSGYLMALVMSVSGAGSANSSMFGRNTVSVVGAYSGAGNIVDRWDDGMYSAATVGLPSSIHISDVNRTGNLSKAIPTFTFAGSI
jgi:hypothetical protein